MQRRIMRRLALRNICQPRRIPQAARERSREFSALHRDLLISVTSFFRDPESFERLKKLVFPRLVQRSARGRGDRIWVAGCATGEEAYSIAISLTGVL